MPAPAHVLVDVSHVSPFATSHCAVLQQQQPMSSARPPCRTKLHDAWSVFWFAGVAHAVFTHSKGLARPSPSVAEKAPAVGTCHTGTFVDAPI